MLIVTAVPIATLDLDTVGVVALGIVFKLKLPEPFQDNEEL